MSWLQLVHEVTHAAVAAARGIKIAPSFLIPNSQLGTFGSVTQVGRPPAAAVAASRPRLGCGHCRRWAAS